MNFKEKLSPSAQKKLSDLLFILYAGGAALLSYSLVYALRKPFTAATFDGMELFGMDYKIATSIIQIFGYMVSKFIGIKLISELKREGRLKFILVSILVAELSLVLFGCLPRPFNVLALFVLDHLPKPTAEDKALRVERVTLNKQQRWNLFRSFAPILTLLFFANLFLTVLQDVKEDFLVKIIDVNAAGLSPWVFAKVDGVVTLIILAIFATLAVMKSHIKVLSVLLTLVIAGAITLSTVAFNYHTLQLSPLVWLFIQSLCLYFSYLSFQTIFFDRFIACFRIKGNVGFFIAMVDSIGYTGTVVVLVVKECFNPDLNWLEFYNTMAGTVGIVCTFAFTLAMIYLTQKYRKGKQGEIRGNESCPVPSLASY